MLDGSIIEETSGACNFRARSIGRVEISGRGSVIANLSSGWVESGVFCAKNVDRFHVLDGARIAGISNAEAPGAVLSTQTLGELLISRSTVTGNKASKGGAFYVRQQISGSVRLEDGAVVARNAALAGSGGFLFAGAGIQVRGGPAATAGNGEGALR